jgi:hypothetical protein
MENYEGKYTRGKLGRDLGMAFLSISRAAGTTLTLTDLITRGNISPEDIARAGVGTLGQLMAAFFVPLQTVSEVVGGVTEEEGKARIPTDSWAAQVYGPPLANVPFARRLLPETVSQTSGEAVGTKHPWFRNITGLNLRDSDRVQQIAAGLGVPSSTLYIRETGDREFDNKVARAYAGLLKEYLPEVLADSEYSALSSPALKRDVLGKILGRIKRAAIGQVSEELGAEEVQTKREAPANRRRRLRWQKYLDRMEAQSPQGPPQPPLEAPFSDGPPSFPE